RDNRRDLLLAAYDATKPAAIIFETFPFGRRSLRFELMPLLERIESDRPRPLVISSVRDILQVQQKRERDRDMAECATRWFDAILVHGDPHFAKFEETFPFLSDLEVPVHYTGFVLAPGSPKLTLAASASADRSSFTSTSDDAPEHSLRNEVVVSAGGGAVGIE